MARRRKNGEGSWGEKTLNGYKYKYYKDSNGKYFYGKTEKEIKAKIKKYNDEARDNTTSTENGVGHILFYDYLKYWLDNIHQSTISDSTYASYDDMFIGELKNYQNHPLGNMQVSAVTTKMINDYYLSLGETYSHSTIKKNYAVLKLFLKYGQKNGEFSYINIEEISIPIKKRIAKKQKQTSFLPIEDMMKLYEESGRVNTPGFIIRGDNIGEPVYGVNAIVLVFIEFTGLRISEALSLHWGDIDYSSNLVKVRRTASIKKNNDKSGSEKRSYIPTETSPKTDDGIRPVPLNKYALEMLERAEKLNPTHTDDDYIFITSRGTKIASRQNVARTLKTMLVRADCSVQDATPHTLRHSFGSYLLSQGVDIKVVSTLLGHSDIAVTYNTYIHLLKEQTVAAVNVFENAQK